MKHRESEEEIQSSSSLDFEWPEAEITLWVAEGREIVQQWTKDM